MVQVRLEKVVDGPGPDEKVVSIKTVSGAIEQVIASGSQVSGNYMQVARIQSERDRVLVELPSESVSGQWRLWLSPEEVK